MNSHDNRDTGTREYDIIVIGAGISGINAGYRIQTNLPNSTYTILEGRSELGGTWSLFKYPGIRSDSDLYTFGFPFNVWTKPNPIATGKSIIEYMNETASKFGIDRKILYSRKVERADWNSNEQRWRLDVNNEGHREVYHAKFVILGTGYYDYKNPLQAEIPGLENFRGIKVHPQFWPEDLNYAGKKMVVIGSGATAITLLPALVDGGASSVTQLQRSPSYILSLPQNKPGESSMLDSRIVPPWISRRIQRSLFIILPYILYLFSRTFPTMATYLLRREIKAQLPKDFPIDPHFKPTYKPFDQRLCFCPDGDFFKCLGSGRAQIVTSTIKTVTDNGILLENGEKLDADIIVTATGLSLQVGGGIQLSVDKKRIHIPDHFLWRSSMLSDVPNIGYIIGYVNASWTLGSDAASRLLTRLIKHMQGSGFTSATPRITDQEMRNPQSLLQLQSTYIKVGQSKLPHAGKTGPWVPRDNYIRDRWEAAMADLNQGIEFKRVAT